jgi:two-component sensor histidine kinase
MISPLDSLHFMRVSERPRSSIRWGWWWLVVTACWTLDGLSGASNEYRVATQAGNPPSWEPLLTMILPGSWMWVIATMLALWVSDRYPLGRGTRLRHLPAHVAMLVVVCVGRAGVVVALNPWVHWYAELPPFSQVVLTSFSKNTFLYLILVGFGHAVVYARRTREREEQLARAELSALKMQLHPHFLFNTLNAIISFVRSEPAVAERMITRLSELLRYTLQNVGVHEVTLAEEIRFIESYLEIEQTRFGDRLRVEWNVDPGVTWARVPHLILQPLVENAVRHGIGPRGSGGRVAIEARRRGKLLELVVRDDGVGMDPANARSGVGLSNTRARLQQLYGALHTLSIDGPAGNGVAVSITFPLRGSPVTDGAPQLVATQAADAGYDDSVLVGHDARGAQPTPGTPR